MEIHVDPLREVRLAKRWALVGTGAAVAILLPVYALLLELTVSELVFVMTPAAITALAGIEMASRWEYRMRRRYAYPHSLGYELASIHDFRQACQRSAELVGQWLKARAVTVAWLSEDGQALNPIASFGLPLGWVESAPRLSLGSRSLRETLESGHLHAMPSALDAWFGSHFAGHRIVYVPLLSRDRPEGVLVLAARRSNLLVRDQRLLAALSMVMGLALDNCRLYEGQRAHAQHMQELNRMKSDFLTTVSHELRTPLTSIMMAAEMLLEEEESKNADTTRRRLVQNIIKGASRLGSLVTDLVNVSREDEFQPRLEMDTVPLADVVSSAVSIIQPLMAAKRQHLDVELDSPETMVRVDRLRFEQVLINLLSNAQRYSPPAGHILVSSRADKSDVIIGVTDSGPGVAAEDRDLIFEPFYRGDRSGLGLGLAIAKSLVELHSGRIWVESSDGQGSTFCVALPSQSAPRARRLTSGAASR